MCEEEIELINKKYFENLNCRILDVICNIHTVGSLNFLSNAIDDLSLMNLNEEIIKCTPDRILSYKLRKIKNINRVNKKGYVLEDDKNKRVLYSYKYKNMEINIPKKIYDIINKYKLTSFKFELKCKSKIYIVIAKNHNKWRTNRICLEC